MTEHHPPASGRSGSAAQRWVPVLGHRLIPNADAMEAFGAELAAVLTGGDLVVLSGELGAGKTTLTRGLGAALGVRGQVTSPTFVLARTHPRSDDAAPLVHVDAYRLGSAAEFDDLDLDFANSIVVVEWGDGMVEDNVDEWLHVRIEGSGERREVTVTHRTREK